MFLWDYEWLHSCCGLVAKGFHIGLSCFIAPHGLLLGHKTQREQICCRHAVSLRTVIPLRKARLRFSSWCRYQVHLLTFREFLRYMAIATNALISDSVNDTMDAARAALVLSLTVMEAIINFLVDIYRSTFLCFVELIVRGALSLLISAVQEVMAVQHSYALLIDFAFVALDFDLHHQHTKRRPH